LHTSTEIPSKTALRRREKHQCQWSGEWRNICSLQNQLTISGKLILTSSRNNNSNKGLNAAPYGYAKLENHETAGISKTEPGGAESRRSITISKYKYDYEYECEFEFQRGGEVIQNKRR